MKKPKKGYQFGGGVTGEEPPKFSNQKQFNDYYKKQGYALFPNSQDTWYDPKKFNITPASPENVAKGRTYEYASLDPSIKLDEFGGIPSQHVYSFPAPPVANKVPVQKPFVRSQQTNMVANSMGQMGPGTYARMENGQSVWYDKAGNPLPVLGKKEGGMVKKGYTRGGWVDAQGNPVDPNDPNLSKYSPEELANLGYKQSGGGTSAANQLMQGGQGFLQQGGYNMLGNALGAGAQGLLDKQHGGPSVGGGIAGGALKGAGLGMQMGGPWGAAIGAIGGGVLGALQSKKAVDQNKQAAEQDVTQQAVANQRNLNQQTYKSPYYNPNDYRTRFGIQGFAKGGMVKGGKVEGPGGPKDDAIEAKVKEDSFVVPAENAGVAEYLRSQYLTKGNQKANLKQKGGDGVYLSNGEHLFTPKETEELMKRGIDVSILAPNSDDNMYSPQNWHFAKGGLTKSKAVEILHDKSVHGHPLTDKQRRYFGAVASGHAYKADGGLVGYLKGGTVKMGRKEFMEEHKELVDILRHGSKAERMKEAMEQKEEMGHYADEGSIGGGDDDPAATHRPGYKRAEVFNNLVDKYRKQGKSPQAAYYLAQRDQSQVKKPQAGNDFTGAMTPQSSSMQLGNKKIYGSANKPNAGLLEAIKFDPTKSLTQNDFIETVPTDQQTPAVTTSSATPFTAAGVAKTPATDNGQPPVGGAPIGSRNRDFGGILGGLQTAIGTGYLMSQGKRPVYSIGPDLQNQVSRSIAQSQYGYTPEQKSLLQNQAVENRNTALKNVYSMSGGNAGVALNNARAVFNDAYANRLKTASDDESLRLQKMSMANQMASQEEAYRRQAFQDKLGAFMQSQNAGASLISAGLENALNSSRYAQAKQAQDEINRLYNM